METITWQEIEQIAKPGDVLYGDFNCPNWIWDDEKKDYQKVIEKKNELVFWDCISCLTDKEDVREGAKIFEHNGKMYEIVDNNPALEKLKQIEDIEEELGIDLEVLFKALKHGFFVKKGTINEGLISLVKAKDIRSIDLVTHNIYFNVGNLVFFENYGKTWALSKEELENFGGNIE